MTKLAQNGGKVPGRPPSGLVSACTMGRLQGSHLRRLPPRRTDRAPFGRPIAHISQTIFPSIQLPLLSCYLYWLVLGWSGGCVGPVRQDAGRVPRRDRRPGARGPGGGLPDETQVVYVSPLKALSNDIQRNLRRRSPASARRCARRACPRSRSAPGCAPATRRRRARPHAPRAAAHRRHHAGVALHPARLGVRPRHARDHAHRDRRRDPRRGREQARRAPGAVARAAGGAAAPPCASACRPRRSRSRRWRASWSARDARRAPMHDRRHGHRRARDLAIEVPPRRSKR